MIIFYMFAGFVVVAAALVLIAELRRARQNNYYKPFKKYWTEENKFFGVFALSIVLLIIYLFLGTVCYLSICDGHAKMELDYTYLVFQIEQVDENTPDIIITNLNKKIKSYNYELMGHHANAQSPLIGSVWPDFVLDYPLLDYIPY